MFHNSPPGVGPIKFESDQGLRRKKTIKVLVTGATGEVGSEVVKAFLQGGADVRAFTRKPRKPGMSIERGGSRDAAFC